MEQNKQRHWGTEAQSEMYRYIHFVPLCLGNFVPDLLLVSGEEKVI